MNRGLSSTPDKGVGLSVCSGIAEPWESRQHPHHFYSTMQPRELAIRMMHDHIVNDLLAIARQYDSLRSVSPEVWQDKVQAEMKLFLQAQQRHQPFQTFCRLYGVVPEVFIAKVLKSATLLLDGTESN